MNSFETWVIFYFPRKYVIVSAGDKKKKKMKCIREERRRMKEWKEFSERISLNTSRCIQLGTYPTYSHVQFAYIRSNRHQKMMEGIRAGEKQIKKMKETARTNEKGKEKWKSCNGKFFSSTFL